VAPDRFLLFDQDAALRGVGFAPGFGPRGRPGCRPDPSRRHPKSALPLAFFLARLEVEGARVDAIPLSCGPGAVVEDVAQVPSAACADNLRAMHKQAVVGPELDIRGVCRLREARPPGARIELRV
jgi:hypothetical protein